MPPRFSNSRELWRGVLVGYSAFQVYYKIELQGGHQQKGLAVNQLYIGQKAIPCPPISYDPCKRIHTLQVMDEKQIPWSFSGGRDMKKKYEVMKSNGESGNTLICLNSLFRETIICQQLENYLQKTENFLCSRQMRDSGPEVRIVVIRLSQRAPLLNNHSRSLSCLKPSNGFTLYLE